MANTRALSSDPLRSFKFNVVILCRRRMVLRWLARLGFMSLSGLGIAIEPLTYREGGDNLTTRKMPGQADFNPITLSRGLFQPITTTGTGCRTSSPPCTAVGQSGYWWNG